MDLIEKISSRAPGPAPAQPPAPPVQEAVEEEARPRPPAEREWIPWFFPVVVFGGVALLLFVYLGQFASMVRTQYRIVALRDKQRNLEREKTDLQLQIQQLTSLERVERIASGRLKMSTPQRRQVIDLDEAGEHKRAVVEKNSTHKQ